MSATVKYILYYNIVTEDLYDENGSYMGNSAFNVFFDNTVNVELHYMTDTSSDDMSNWIPWTGLQGNTTGSSICFDDDYLHAALGSVSEDSSIGSTILKVSSTLSESNVNPSDSLVLYNADGTSVSLPYTGYTYSSGVYSFELASALSTAVSTGLDVRVPQALLLKVYSDEIDQTEASTGVFKFSMNVLSHKLLNRLDYSNTTKVSGMFEHQIYSDGENVATFTFPMSVTNLIDYRGNANVPVDGTWADKAYVDSKIPMKVSELQNDAGYISEQTDPVYTADKPLIALKQELFSKSFNDLSDVPNTIAGYGIVDASISGNLINLGQNSIQVPDAITADVVKELIGISSDGNAQKVLNQKGEFVYTPAVYTVNGVTYDVNGNVDLQLSDIISVEELQSLLPNYVRTVNGYSPDQTGNAQIDLSSFSLQIGGITTNVQEYLQNVQSRLVSLQNGGGGGGSTSITVNNVEPDTSGNIALTLQNFNITVSQQTTTVDTFLRDLNDAMVRSVCSKTPISGDVTLEATDILYTYQESSQYTNVSGALDDLLGRVASLEQGGGGGGGQLCVLSVDGTPPDPTTGDVTLQYSVNGYNDTLSNILNSFQGRIYSLQQGSTYVLTKAAVDEVIGASATGSATMFYNQQGAFASIDLTPYALKSELFSKSFKDLTNVPTTIAGYGITDANINGRVITLGGNSIEVPEGGSTYVLTKEAVDGVIGASATGSATMFYNQQGAFVSIDLTGYATESFVTSQGYITISALEGYATATDVSTAVSNHNAATDAHTALFNGKENAGVAQGLVDGHNQSSEAHSALFEDKADKTELSAYLPLAGGTMTGTIETTETTNTITSANERIIISGGSTYLKGGNLRLYGDGYSGAMAGGFALVTHANETQKAVLQGTPDGLLRWGGQISGSAYSAGLHLYAGTNNHHGATLQLFPCDHDDYAGRFYLRASTKTTSTSGGSSCDLIGIATGTLTWGGKDITLGYPKYSSGISVGTVSSYTVAQNGWLYAWSRRDGKYWHLCVGGVLVFSTGGSGYDASTCFIPVKKGDVIKTYNGYSGQETAFAVAMKLYPNR